MIRVRRHFQCRLFTRSMVTCTLTPISTDAFLATHVNFNHVNEIEARYKVLRLNVKFSEILLYTYVRPFIHCLYVICERKFYARTHGYAVVEINPNCDLFPAFLHLPRGNRG